ncbi:50S ribosomal protein L4 [Saccharolobus islandicus]|uniref:Large ribosomal subunit protein uL4 n=1 Tax=Saccharolobus islandicus (strain L.D.8.5 / Lassen \|nr:50S ribosomal protein L4 [Sulfolobus islandicus]ADB87292.1 ribosomal protein L4/L1e [Sulfolobus islandicus L.D.8.5]
MYLELVKKNSVILDKDGNKVKEVELPFIFSFPVRKDIIRRVFLAEFTHSLQPKGRDPMAGKRTSAESFGINLGMARVPRVKNSGEAALAPNTVGGRLTFPPSVDKKLVEEVNDKEKQLAVISALSATADKVFVKARGHVFKDSVSFPIVVTDDIVRLKTASEVEEFLEKIGVYDDVKRVKERIRIRAGKGKMRGRKYKESIGPLIIVHDSNSPIVKAARNIAGVDVVNAKDVSVIHLAPGAHSGRLTIYTETSIKILDERLSKRLVS